MAEICIIVGHGKSKNGGYDSGAVSGKYHEFRIAKEIAKYAAEYLNKFYPGIADIMNYNGDIYLADRIRKVNKSNYDFIAEIHLNAGGGTGTETYYFNGSKKSRKYADRISKNISSDLGIRQRPNYGTDAKADEDKDGGDKTKLNNDGEDYFGIIRETKPCAVLVETVFIDTASDLEKIKTDDGQRICGYAIAKGIMQARELEYKEDIKPVTKPATPAVKPSVTTDTSFLVEVIYPCLNIRNGAGTLHKKVGEITDKGTYTIIETNKAGTWGKLKSGAGWICIKPKYVRKK